MLGTVAAVLSLLQDFVYLSQAILRVLTFEISAVLHKNAKI